MPLSLLNHSALALFAQRTRIPTSARSIGFCAIWVCISSSSSSCVTSQVHEAILCAIFCPSKESSQCFSQAPGASRSQHRLSCRYGDIEMAGWLSKPQFMTKENGLASGEKYTRVRDA